MAPDVSINAVQSRIEDTLPVIHAIKEHTCSSSISFGVVHQGQVIYTKSLGFRDAEKMVPADVDTTYLLASVTKAFIAAACGILVDEGKLDWTIRSPSVEGTTIVDKEDLVQVFSNLPAKYSLRGGYHYNNYCYAVVGKIVDHQAGCPWHEFLLHRIFKPLGMERTTTNRKKLPDTNLAEPHVVLDDRSILKIKPVDVADDTIMGAAGGIWSSISDMMIWAKALLEAMHEDDSSANSHPPSPLKQIRTIVSHKTCITKSSLNQHTYGFSFARATTPSTELGMLSLNGPQREHVLGKNSAPQLVLYHNGGQSGYLSSFYLFLETHSAVVALGNSYGLGDGPDWTAQAIMQAMFDLEPKLDFAHISQNRAKHELERYARLSADYLAHHGEANESFPPLVDFVGCFENVGLKMTLDIRLPHENSFDEIAETFLHLVINKRDSRPHQIRHYREDMLGMLPASRRELILREFIDWFEWSQFVLDFRRCPGSGQVIGLEWAMEVGLPAVAFRRAL